MWKVKHWTRKIINNLDRKAKPEIQKERFENMNIYIYEKQIFEKDV